MIYFFYPAARKFERMISIIAFFVLISNLGSTFSLIRLNKPVQLLTRTSKLFIQSPTHSATFNRFKNAIKETDESFSIEELEELQELIKESISRHRTAPSQSNSLHELCEITHEACVAVTPMLQAFYAKITEAENTKGTEYFTDLTAKLKSDATFFSIADGIVQHMFIDFLFQGNKFAEIVGEEDDTVVNLTQRPYTVDDLVVPEEFNDLVDLTMSKIVKLSERIDSQAYKKLTVFCDPIDGTREFATGKGDSVSILIGYNDQFGKPVAGIIYRPLTEPPTWAAGAASENCVMGHLDTAITPNPNGILVTDGKISPFMNKVIDKMGYEKVNSLASGNRALMLLEGKAGVYIRDTGGFSKWDTSGPQAVIEAYGGTMSKLPSFLSEKSLESYTHLKTEENLDFEENLINLSLSNAKDKSQVKKDETRIEVDGATTTTYVISRTVKVSDVGMVKPYNCLQGLVALDKENMQFLDKIHTEMLKVKAEYPPTYN